MDSSKFLARSLTLACKLLRSLTISGADSLAIQIVECQFFEKGRANSAARAKNWRPFGTNSQSLTPCFRV